jgi:hypothetical protein
MFRIEIETRVRGGATLRIIASIEEPRVIARILARLQRTAPTSRQVARPLGARASPEQSRLLRAGG